MLLIVFLLLALALPAPALAATEDVACVGVTRPECTLTPDTLGAALAAKAHLIILGPGPFTGTFATAGPVEIAGTDGTVIRGRLSLTGTSAAVHNVRIEERLDAGPDTILTLDDDDLAAVVLDHVTLTARGSTFTDSLVVAGGKSTLSSSLVTADDPFTVSDGATVSTTFSAYAEDADATGPDRVDPPADPRGLGDPALLDRGDPAALAPFEPFEDAAGLPRIAGARRDIGAYETQPSPVPISPSSVLANGGAEDGLAGWSGNFASAGYGDSFLPTALAGRALGGGARFFSGAGEAAPDLAQRIDVGGAATSIDAGLGRATLSGLLGGYGADPDALTVRAVFKDPENHELGSLTLDPVGAAQRANDTNLLRREAGGAIPQRTRAIDVFLHADRRAGGYTDAYADNLGLVLSVPGVPSKARTEDPPQCCLKPFNGVSVLTAQPRFSAKGGARVLLACASSTVGSCSGSLELRAILPGQTVPRRIGRFATFTVRHGTSQHIVDRLLVASRKRVLRLRQLSATLVAVARDGQGLERITKVPVTLKLPGRAIR